MMLCISTLTFSSKKGDSTLTTAATSSEDAVEYHSHRPNISRVGLILLLSDDLRCKVLQCAALVTHFALEDSRTVLKESAQPEIHQLDVVVLIHQNVLGFDVSVGNSPLFQVLNCLAELLEILPSLILGTLLGI
jgi:hypothetical protein